MLLVSRRYNEDFDIRKLLIPPYMYTTDWIAWTDVFRSSLFCCGCLMFKGRPQSAASAPAAEDRELELGLRKRHADLRKQPDGIAERDKRAKARLTDGQIRVVKYCR